MNPIRAKYLYQVGNYYAGYPENLREVDESFLRHLEEMAGIAEMEVDIWRRIVMEDFFAGKCDILDAKMGHILQDRGCLV